MNNTDHISESLETIFLVKILKFLLRIRDGKKFGSGIRDGKKSDPGSNTEVNIIFYIWFLTIYLSGVPRVTWRRRNMRRRWETMRRFPSWTRQAESTGMEIRTCAGSGGVIRKKQGDFLNLFMYCIQHCFLCRPSDFTLSEDAGIEPRTVVTSSWAVLSSNHSARSRMRSSRGGNRPNGLSCQMLVIWLESI